jgi:hypothetical protein
MCCTALYGDAADFGEGVGFRETHTCKSFVKNSYTEFDVKILLKCLAADTTSRTDEWMRVPRYTFLFDVVTNTGVVDGCDCRLGYHRDWPLHLVRSHWVCPTVAQRGTIKILIL